MRWLRIAIALTVSLLTTVLCLTPVQAASGTSWSVLSDPEAGLQLNDVRSPRLSSQFIPVDLGRLGAAGPGEALWLRVHLEPDKHEQILRAFAPDLARLDMYAFDDQKLISEVSIGAASHLDNKPLPGSDYLLPLPQSPKALDVYLRMVSDHQLRPNITLDTAIMLAANQNKPLLYGLLLGCMAMLLLHNLIRFAFTRSPSSLWLAICEALLMSSSILFLNLLDTWLPDWSGMRIPGAYVALLLTAPCGLMFTYSFCVNRGSHPLHKLLLLDILIISLGGLLLLFIDDLPLNHMTYALVGLASISILVVSIYHWQKGYTRPACLSQRW